MSLPHHTILLSLTEAQQQTLRRQHRQLQAGLNQAAWLRPDDVAALQATMRAGLEAQPGEDRPPTYPEFISFLHQKIGGNFFALEQFDELYRVRQDRLPATLAKLAEQYQRETDETMAAVSQRIIFAELLALLTEPERQNLQLLTNFRAPVTAVALTLQDRRLPAAPALRRLVDLTLVEQTREEALDLAYYYLTPLIKELLQKEQLPPLPFSHDLAGQYFEYAQDALDGGLPEAEEALFHYLAAGNVEKVDQLGFPLTRHYHLTGVLPKALVYLEEMLALFRAHQDRQNEGTTLNNISQIYDARGDYDQALDYLQQSLKILQEIGNKQGMSYTMHNMASIAYQKQDIDLFFKLEVQAYQIAVAIQDANGVYNIGRDLGYVLCMAGNTEEGLPLLRRSLQIGRQAGYPNVGKVEALVQRFEQA